MRKVSGFIGFPGSGRSHSLSFLQEKSIRRSIAIIRPKQPFVDWANQLPDAELKSSLDDFKTDCLAILIPDYDTDKEAEGYISEIYEDIFIEILLGWCTEEAWFPQDRTNEMFWQWFEVELHPIVMDSCMEPIEEEEQLT